MSVSERQGERRLLVLLGLRLKAAAAPGALAALWALPEPAVAAELVRAEEQGQVERRDAAPVGWRLTPAGRAHGERLLAEALERSGGRAAVEAAYARFLPLNAALLEICSAWQVRAPQGRLVVNDHQDAAYDRAVLVRLDRFVAAAGAWWPGLERALPRAGAHRRRFEAAAERVGRGETSFVAAPLVDSVHTVWFEQHEDLLATLGRDRSEEAGAAGPGRSARRK
ncbi:MAG: transcriptional regulator [Acidimicrobiales bacterium]